MQPLDLLMWVGTSFYTTESYIKEAKQMGVCKRIAGVPIDIEVGKSKLFLAHDNGKKGEGKVIAYCVIRGISYIVESGVDIPEELKKRGVEKYEYVSAAEGGGIPKRGCGYIAVGGTYLLSEEDMEKCKDLAQSSLAEGRIEVIKPPVAFGDAFKRFRGCKYCLGDKILERAPVEEWFNVKQIREANRLEKAPPAKGAKYEPTPKAIAVLKEISALGGTIDTKTFQEICAREELESKTFIRGVGKPLTYVRGDKVTLTAAGRKLIEEKPAEAPKEAPKKRKRKK